MKPYDLLPDTIIYHEKEYPLNLSYSVFFAVSDVLEDERLMNLQKLEIALDLFITEAHPVESDLLSDIYDLLKDDRPKNNGPIYMDIEQDWPYICAGFQQAYGVDLYTEKDIHILRWQALLQGLPKDTKLMEIIGIRAMDVPAPNKHNQKQIAEINRLKAMYALRGSAKNFQKGLGALFDLLEARAKGA